MTITQQRSPYSAGSSSSSSSLILSLYFYIILLTVLDLFTTMHILTTSMFTSQFIHFAITVYHTFILYFMLYLIAVFYLLHYLISQQGWVYDNKLLETSNWIVVIDLQAYQASVTKWYGSSSFTREMYTEMLDNQSIDLFNSHLSISGLMKRRLTVTSSGKIRNYISTVSISLLSFTIT